LVASSPFAVLLMYPILMPTGVAEVTPLETSAAVVAATPVTILLLDVVAAPGVLVAVEETDEVSSATPRVTVPLLEPRDT